MSSYDKNRSNPRSRQRGQIVIEYVLLLMVVVTIATVLIRFMVKRSPNPEEQGFVVKGWQMMLQDIGSDPADEPASDPATP